MDEAGVAQGMRMRCGPDYVSKHVLKRFSWKDELNIILTTNLWRLRVFDVIVRGISGSSEMLHLDINDIASRIR